MMAVFWFTEALPIGVTACLPLVLFPALGVFGKGWAGDLLSTAGWFVDAYVFLILGGMAIGAAMEQWNLHRRVALHIMRIIGSEPRRLLLGILAATATVSLWITNSATAVMMLPIALALVRQLEASRGGRRLEHFGAAAMLGVAYASNVGGIGTKIGTATNSVFAGFVSANLHVEIGFLQFMLAALPFVLLFIPVVWMVLWPLARLDDVGVTEGREVLDRELAALGPMRRGEKVVAAVFAGAALLWALGDPLRTLIAAHLQGVALQSRHYEAGVAMAAAASLFLLRTLSFAAMRRMPFGTLLLLGGAFSMAAGIEGSGLAEWIALRIEAVAASPLWLQLLLTSAATILLSAVASNIATINVMLNLLPRSMPVLFTAAVAASCDFALPAGTPPNAIVFASGYIRLSTMMRVGVVLDLLAAALLTVYVLLFARFVM
jgi:sodium-dependent dicarboxylate transporter 2/3/5